ncbi:MAG: GntR family transcriptional regulator [Gemmatimonadota bacterium]|nr:GntR family transcriptional regulator [Gemmatimonadota bacterium]
MAQAPRYRELADELREVILSGQALLDVELVDGAQLPTEPELGTHFQVSRGTIRQALRELAAEGLLETRGRNGTYVRRLPMLEYNADSEDPHRRDDPQGTTDTWFSVVKQAGREPSQDFRFRIVPASAVVASRLGVVANDLVVVRECQRYVNEVPWSEQVSYYPYALAQKCALDTPQDIPEGTVRRMAARGVVEDRLDHEISSRPASDDERRRFDLAPGVSVLIYQRTGQSLGTIVRYTREVLPADRNVITHTTANAADWAT